MSPEKLNLNHEKQIFDKDTETSVNIFSVRNISIGLAGLVIIVGGILTYTYKDTFLGSKTVIASSASNIQSTAASVNDLNSQKLKAMNQENKTEKSLAGKTGTISNEEVEPVVAETKTETVSTPVNSKPTKDDVTERGNKNIPVAADFKEKLDPSIQTNENFKNVPSTINNLDTTVTNGDGNNNNNNINQKNKNIEVDGKNDIDGCVYGDDDDDKEEEEDSLGEEKEAAVVENLNIGISPKDQKPSDAGTSVTAPIELVTGPDSSTKPPKPPSPPQASRGVVSDVSSLNDSQNVPTSPLASDSIDLLSDISSDISTDSSPPPPPPLPRSRAVRSSRFNGPDTYTIFFPRCLRRALSVFSSADAAAAKKDQDHGQGQVYNTIDSSPNSDTNQASIDKTTGNENKDSGKTKTKIWKNGNIMIAHKANSLSYIFYKKLSNVSLFKYLSSTRSPDILHQHKPPVFSFDGTKVAFFDTDTICTMNSDGTGKKKIFSDEPGSFSITDLSFSPDGNKIILVGKINSFEAKDTFQIYEMNANLCNQKYENLEKITNFKLNSLLNIKNPTYSPDGKFIIFFKKTDSGVGPKISIIDAETRELINEFQTDSRLFYTETFAYFSNEDGVGIAFPEHLYEGEDKSQISFFESVDNFKTLSQKKCIYMFESEIHSLTWSPDLYFFLCTLNSGLKTIIIDIDRNARYSFNNQFAISSLLWSYELI